MAVIAAVSSGAVIGITTAFIGVAACAFMGVVGAVNERKNRG